MRKNVIHNFDLSIKNSADGKSSEELTQTIIQELAKVSQEMNQQKDIVQIWQEQKSQNAAIANNSSFSTGGGAIDTSTKTSEKPLSIGNTSSVSGETINNVALSGATSTTNALIGEGVADITGRKTINSTASNNITSPTSGAGNTTLNFNNGITQTYANVAAQQTLTVPQVLQTNNSEPTIEAIKTEIKKKLDAATDMETIQYWRNIAKAFNEGATAQDFDGKPNNMLFTQMYAILKQSNTAIENQNFNWEIIREKMIKSINTNILSGIISDESKKRWTIIQQQLKDDKVNITNLFEQYGELFLLLKEVEGLNALPSTITITTKTKIYPNLSALYPAIGKEDVYVFLKGISDIRGSAVDKGAVKIKNTVATSFIVGESLEFTLDETFIKQSQFQKENINWIVYHVGNKQESIFRDKGTSLTYNFDKAGTYRIDAYGNKHTVKGNKKALGSTFIELKIEAQQIIITSPGITKDGQTRTSTKEKLFKVDLKYPKVKTLNPLKLYYQVETKTGNKVTIVSEEQELDSTGIIKFPIPNLGEYCIKLTSKDQYALNKEYKINAIKNEVTSIGQVGKASNIGHFLVGVSNNTLTLETKTFKINPATDEEKEDVKWIIYDSNNKPYLPPGSVVLSDDNNPKKTYLHKWSYFDVPLPKKEGHYTVEAYNDTRQGTKAKSVFSIEMMRAQITEAYWASGGGSKKRMSGFEGESNWIKANIPYYNNQTVRIYFYLNTIKTKYYLDTKTNERGEIFQEIKFDSDFQKQIGFQGSKNAKIGFKVLGIQNGKPYPFKAPTNYESDTVLGVTTDIKILDAYFMYDGKRVTSQDEIPFDKKGTTLTIVAKTQNMVGKQIVLTAHKVGEKPAFKYNTTVNSEGVATISFLIAPAKGLKNGTVNKYYVGIEGYSTKHLTDKMMNLVVGTGKANENHNSKTVNQDIKLQEARIRAFLRMIRVGEGTTTAKGYEKIFGGSSFIDDYKKNWEDHPGIVIRAKGKDSKGNEKIYYSSASGAYQVKKDIWDDWGKKFREFYDIKDFSPESQDKFALVILKHKRGKDVIRLIREDKIEDAVKLCQGEWASLPDSPHGQPTVTWETVMTKYNNFLKEELEGKSPLSIKSGFLKDLGYGDDQKKEIINDVVLRFTGSSANRLDLSFKTINVLKEVASISKNFEIKITSTKRATYDQARIMYENCESTGGKYQKEEVYGKVGDKIIEVYILEAEIGKKEKEVVIKKMEEKIIELGSENVSKHLGDYVFMETFDIQYSGLSNPRDFKKEFLKRKELDDILYEPKNNCYHIQINQ